MSAVDEPEPNSTLIPSWQQFKSLRWQLVLRTLLPLGLLVGTFAVVAQVGYTQVSESLARNRDTEIAKLETARLADYLLDSVRSFKQLGQSPILLWGDDTQVLNALRDESLSQHFDFLLVARQDGSVSVTSDGSAGGKLLDSSALDYLKGDGLPMTIGPGRLPDGRGAIVLSMRYKDTQGEFAGLVQGGIAYGSQKLAAPLQDIGAGAYQGVPQPNASGFSYLAAGDRMILWHPDPAMVGTSATRLAAGGVIPDSPGAEITNIDNVRYIVGYAPLNLGQLLTQASPYRPWIQWYIVTQHRWADVIAPLNTLLYLLAILALTMFLLALVLVARSAGRLTVPVAKLVTASQALSAGKLQHRLDLLDISGPSEIEELARQFNAMAEQLHASYSGLEQKVAERTGELASANLELARRLRESQTMQEVVAKFASTAGLEEILETVVTSTIQALETQGSIVFLPSRTHIDMLEVAMVKDVPGLEIGSEIVIASSLTGLVFRTGEPQISASTQEDPRVDPNLVQSTGAISTLIVPLVSRGQVIGVLNTINKQTGAFSEEDVRLLSLFANQAAVAIERARLYADARRQVDILETLNELSLLVTASRSVEETLAGGMEHIGKLLDAQSAVIFLHNDTRRTLDMAATYNVERSLRQLLATHQSLPVDREYDRLVAAVEAFKRQAPVVVSDMGDPEYLRTWRPYFLGATGLEPGESMEETETRSLVALPLTVRDKALGSMTVYFREVRRTGSAEVRLFQSFANILALAVYNTQLVAQTSKLATVEERARLARELHDSVTQSLFSLNLTLKAARRSIDSNPVKADALLDSVQELAQGALAEMRALIFELRPQALANEGLISALQKHAESVRARSGLQVHLETKGDRRLPLDYEEALYQIAREALHNVVKHSQATEAWVSLALANPEVVLSVRDNGKGFDPEQVLNDGGSHIGTSTMRERAETIGGVLEINSCQGCGTEVVVRTAISDSKGHTAANEPETTTPKGAVTALQA